jgi:hypothetical protein
MRGMGCDRLLKTEVRCAVIAIFISCVKLNEIFKGTASRKSWRDTAMESESRLQLRIATSF